MKFTDEHEFRIKYEGKICEINIDTLINSLLSISSSLQEINSEIKSDKKIEIRIKPIREGSFPIDLHIISNFWDAITSIASPNNIYTAASIVAILAGYLQIKKHLLGDKPKQIISGENVTVIENSKGSKIEITNQIYNIYTGNTSIDRMLSKGFDGLNEDDNITGFEVLDDDKPIFKASHDDFSVLATPNPIDETSRIITDRVMLSVVKVVFIKKRKWNFYYMGNPISAILNDDDFYNRIDAGESFAKGDILEVELEIKQRFDKSVNTFVNESYYITKVIAHIPREKQTPISF